MAPILPRVKPGDKITASAYNALADAIDASGLTVASGDELAMTNGVIYSTRRREYWIKLTSSSGAGTSTVYAWTAVARDGSGGWVETALHGTTTDNAAHSVNGTTAITTLPYYVRAVQEPDGMYFFSSSC